jgi:hypothetical protein
MTQEATSKAEEKSLAERMHDGARAEAIIEDRIDDLFPELVCKIGSDYYDNSLEVYMSPETPKDFSVTQEQADEIFKMGFSRFWFNFTDGSEQTAIAKGEFAGVKERRMIPNNQRWTEEKAKEYL